MHDILRVVRIGDPETLFKLFHRLVENIQRFKTDTYSVLRLEEQVHLMKIDLNYHLDVYEN